MTVDLATHFPTKADAFAWYADQGGQRQKSSFYAVVPANGKAVSRFAVSELLRKERQGAKVVEGYAEQREDAERRKAIADARKAEIQTEELERGMDRKWMLREDAEAETCVWVGRLRDATAYHIGRQLLALIHACGGKPERLAEAQAIVDSALADAANEIANSGELTVTIEDIDAA